MLRWGLSFCFLGDPCVVVSYTNDPVFNIKHLVNCQTIYVRIQYKEKYVGRTIRWMYNCMRDHLSYIRIIQIQMWQDNLWSIIDSNTTH